MRITKKLKARILFGSAALSVLLIAAAILFFPPNFLMRYSVPLQKLIVENVLCGEEVSPSVFGYYGIIDNEDFKILKRPYRGEKIIGAYQQVVVTLNDEKNRITIYPNYESTLFSYSVTFHERNFADLIEGSAISHCMIIPYLRKVDRNLTVRSWRLVVVTDKGQVYHNYPSRGTEYEGLSRYEDMILFEESAVWDLPGRKYPSKDENCALTERYFPGLPDQAYEYHPALNTDERFVDVYGNGGFPQTTTVTENGRQTEVSRFYFPLRTAQANSFYFMSGFEADDKMALVGTYRSNTETGVRVVLFASDDGGRNWYAKYEFGDTGEYDFRQGDTEAWGHNFGNPINTSAMTEFRSGSMYVIKRNVVSPNENDKEPQALFTWGNRLVVDSITSSEKAMVTTRDKHGLQTGNIIALSAAEQYRKDSWYWVLNDGISSVSWGNGLFFKVEVVDEYSFFLYEYVSSPSNPITCRHIHHINRIKDGYLIGTGEVYPNGWLLYLQMKEADTYTVKNASDEFRIIRLNSSEASVQRTLGAILFDDAPQTFLYASDHDLLPREERGITDGRTEAFSRSSTGIYKGSLEDIDNYSAFELIYEAKEPAFFFKQLNGALIFSGQRGEFAVSRDGGQTWHSENIGEPLTYYYGKTYAYYVFGDYLLIIK